MTFTEMTGIYRSIGKSKKCTFIFCADHGVADMNVSAYPKTVTVDMVKNYLLEEGGAANAFAKFARSELAIVDVGVDADLSDLPGLVDRKIARGTKNIAEGSAMTKAQARKSIKIGKDLAEQAIKAGKNCFLIGEMGIANTTVASAITAAILEMNPRFVTGRGSNISDKRLKEKIKIVRKALKVNKPDSDDAIDVLAKVGGFEFGAMAGVILAAAKHHCITILDGFNTAAAALIAAEINPRVENYLIASHLGREIGHTFALKYMALTPMFTLDLALGEAVGSSIAAKILDSLVYTDVCDPEDDFDEDEENDEEEISDEEVEKYSAELFSQLIENFGIGELSRIKSLDDLEELMEDRLSELEDLESVDVDFHLGDDERSAQFEPPFSAADFNIPRSYPMLVRVMGGQNDDSVAASDKTFNFYLQTMPGLHEKAMENCRDYLDNLTKPKNSLGLLEDIAIQVAGIMNKDIPTNKLRHAALAFTNKENAPEVVGQTGRGRVPEGSRRNVPMNFSITARTFAMKIFMGVIDPRKNPTVAFNFGRTLAEEISFGTPIIALTDLSDWKKDRLDEKFAKALLTDENKLKVKPEDFLSNVPKKFQCLTSAILGAMVAAAHNATLIVVDCGAVEIIARYLEEMCPQIRPFLLYSTKLVNYQFEPGYRIGYDGENACMAVEIVEAALTALNEMKTFGEADVGVAIDGAGAGIQTKDE